MSTTIKRAVITGAIVAGLALGGTGIAVASANPAVSSKSGSGTDDQDPSFIGTVPAPAGAADAGNETASDQTAGEEAAGEEAAARALQPFATTTSAEATAAALKVVPGTAGTALLESENGYVVYGIEITKADGTVVDVKVDAGNGTVLAQEIDSETNDD